MRRHRLLWPALGMLALPYLALGCSGGGGTPDATPSPTPIPGPPATPTNLQAAVGSKPTTIELTWKDNATDETKYLVQRKIESGAWADLVTNGPVNMISLELSDQEYDTTFSFRVAAVRTSTASAFSNEVTIKTPLFTQPRLALTAPYTPNFMNQFLERVRWNGGTLKIYVDKGTDARDLTTLKNLVLAGANRWKAALDLPGDFSLDFALTDVEAQAQIVVKLVPATDSELVAAKTLGITNIVGTPAAPRGIITKATTKMTKDLTNAQTEILAAHELGHALGIIGHSTNSGDLMYPAIVSPGAISQRDANTLAYLYKTNNP